MENAKAPTEEALEGESSDKGKEEGAVFMVYLPGWKDMVLWWFWIIVTTGSAAKHLASLGMNPWVKESTQGGVRSHKFTIGYTPHLNLVPKTVDLEK